MNNADNEKPPRLGAEQQRLLDELVANIGVGGLAVVTGATGVGKTALTQALVARLGETTITAQLAGPATRSDFAAGLAQAWNIDPANGVLRGVHATLAEATKTRRSVALIVDDAHALDRATFRELSDLVELRVPYFPARLSIVLVGDRRLDVALATFASSLASRVAFRHELLPFTFDEVSEFLLERLGAAGCQTSLLAPRVLSVIAAETRGLPRLVEALCDALVEEHRRGTPLTGATIQKYLVALDAPRPRPAPQVPKRTKPPGWPSIRRRVWSSAPRLRWSFPRLRWSPVYIAGAIAVPVAGLALVFLTGRAHSPALVVETVNATVTTPSSAASDTGSAPQSVAPVAQPEPVAPVARPEPAAPAPRVEIVNRPVEPPKAAPIIVTAPVSPRTAPPASSPGVRPVPRSPQPIDPEAGALGMARPPGPTSHVWPTSQYPSEPSPGPTSHSHVWPPSQPPVATAPSSPRLMEPVAVEPRVETSPVRRAPKAAAAAPAQPTSLTEPRQVPPSKARPSERPDDPSNVIDWLLQHRR